MNNCPAYGKTCKQCGLKNHFKNKCRKKEISVVKGQGQINNIETDNMCVSIDALEVMNVKNNEINNYKSWIGEISINGMETKIKLDTGAELNVIPMEMIKKIKGIKLSDSNVTIKSFGGFITKSKGRVTLELENNKIKLYRVFEVVGYEGLPLLSYEACVSLQYKMPEISVIDSMTIMKLMNLLRKILMFFKELVNFQKKFKLN